MPLRISLLSLGLITISLGACSPSKKKDDSDKQPGIEQPETEKPTIEQSTNKQPPLAQPPVAVPPITSPLLGLWQADCDDDFSQEKLEFTASTVTEEFSLFNSQCETKHLEVILTYPYTAQLSAGTIDLGTYTRATVRVFDQEGADFLKETAFCGKNDWQINGDFNDEECSGDTASYDIFKIEGGKLYLGKSSEDNDGSTAAKRPTEIDTNNIFTKK